MVKPDVTLTEYYKRKYQFSKELETLVTEHDYVMIEPGYFEDYHQFIARNKRIKDENIVKLMNRNKVLVLRPDVTNRIINDMLPEYSEGQSFKWFYHTTTFNQTMYGDIDEVKTFGIEWIGENGPKTSADVVLLAITIFEQFNLNVQIELNSTYFIDALIEGLALSDKQITRFKRILYTKDKDALNAFSKTIKPTPYIALCERLWDYQGDLALLKTMMKEEPLSIDMAKALEDVITIGQVLQSKDAVLTFDLSMVSQYDYHEGFVFKAYCDNVSHAVLSGGCYKIKNEDTGVIIPAIGFSMQSMDVFKEVLNNE